MPFKSSCIPSVLHKILKLLTFLSFSLCFSHSAMALDINCERTTIKVSGFKSQEDVEYFYPKSIVVSAWAFYSPNPKRELLKARGPEFGIIGNGWIITGTTYYLFKNGTLRAVINDGYPGPGKAKYSCNKGSAAVRNFQENNGGLALDEQTATTNLNKPSS